MDRVHVDLLGPLPLSSKGNRYVLMCIDQFTRWIEVSPLPEQNAELVATATVNDFISRMGLPLNIHTDQGRQFEGTLFQLLEIGKTRTTPYHPSSNDQVERSNRQLLQSIRCYLEGKQQEWDRYLPLIAMALRGVVNRSTGFTPNMMMLEREVVAPLELATGMAGINRELKSVSTLLSRMEDVHNWARSKMKETMVRQKRIYDQKLKQTTFEKGDLVYKLNSASVKGVTKKLQPIYNGPYVVTQILSPVTIKIEGRKGAEVVHHDRLRICPDRVMPLWMRRKRHHILTADQVDLDQEESQDRRGHNGHFRYSRPRTKPLRSAISHFSRGSYRIFTSTAKLSSWKDPEEAQTSSDAHLISSCCCLYLS